MDNQDVMGLVKKALEEAFREQGHANVLIAGRTGVGKSTLINSVFQGNLATTGQGKPVTRNTQEINKDGVPLTIFDTRGLEMADYANTLGSLKEFISDRQKNGDQKKQIHVAWFCVVEDLRRIEDADTQLVEMLAEFMPVVVVITKARADKGFQAEVQRLLPKARTVMRVRAISEELDDGHTMAPMGLESLVNLTISLLPEAQQRAFVAAQKADLDLKKQRSRMIVASAAVSAAGVAATPIPFADAFLIVPIQIGMVAGISATYGLPLSTAFIFNLVASSVGGGAATLTGRILLGGLVKLFPGAGSVAGGAINAATASTITTTFGEAYITALDSLFAMNHGEPPTAQQVLDEFQKWFRK